MSTARFVVGTAGHIDHGKTALVRALTGIDTDRLPEEKARGITIELGFAHLTLDDGTVVGLVDVPGHERFVRTMVAGAVGLDLVVLVVAADEGMMPQTREHLAICGLLGQTRGVVALTKCDLVDGDLGALAEDDIRGTLAGTFLEGAPILRCSARTGDGIEALRTAIGAALATAPPRPLDGLVRLPIDRVFSQKGHGTVVTGTLWGGRIAVDDELVPQPTPAALAGQAGKVRQVQVHGAPVAAAEAGNRTAVNLTLPHEALTRGMVLCRPGELVAGQYLDVRLQVLPTCRAPLPRRSRVLVHLGTDHTQATVNLLDQSEVAPGGNALAQILLDRPLVALPGDRFIVRGFRVERDHSSTLGGGVILRTLGARHRRGTPALVALLRDNERAAQGPTMDERVALEIDRRGELGIDETELRMRLPSASRKALADALQRLSTARRIVRWGRDPNLYASADALATTAEQVLDAVTRHHAEQPLAPGMATETLRSHPGAPPRLRQLAIEQLLQRGALVAVDERHIRLPSHDPTRAEHALGLDALADAVVAALAERGLEPPRPSELASALGTDEQRLEAALATLQRAGRVVRLRDLVFAQSAIAVAEKRLVAYLQTTPEITPQAWKELLGVSRKFSIPLAEYFDATKLTLRVGDNRRLRKR